MVITELGRKFDSTIVQGIQKQQTSLEKFSANKQIDKR